MHTAALLCRFLSSFSCTKPSICAGINIRKRQFNALLPPEWAFCDDCSSLHASVFCSRRFCNTLYMNTIRFIDKQNQNGYNLKSYRIFLWEKAVLSMGKDSSLMAKKPSFLQDALIPSHNSHRWVPDRLRSNYSTYGGVVVNIFYHHDLGTGYQCAAAPLPCRGGVRGGVSNILAVRII